MPDTPRRDFTILLVEDDPADATMFRELLLEVAPDVVVHHAEHGLEALRLLRPAGHDDQAVRPNLIILDLNMPVMDGYTFLREIKNLEGTRRVPTLILSTSDRPSDVETSYDAQAAGYLVKPSGYQQYRQLLEVVSAYWTGTVRLPRLGGGAG